MKQEPEAVAQAEGMEGRCLLAYSALTQAEGMEGRCYWLTPLYLPILLSHAPEDHLPRGGTTLRGLDTPTTFKRCPRGLPTGHHDGASSQLRLTLPRLLWVVSS